MRRVLLRVFYIWLFILFTIESVTLINLEVLIIAFMLGELLSAVRFEVFVAHWDIPSCTQGGLALKKLLITPFKNVNLWVEYLRIAVHMEAAIELAEGRVHGGSALLAELTMEDDDRVHKALHRFIVAEEQSLHAFGVLDVDCVLNVPPLILIVKSAVDN